MRPEPAPTDPFDLRPRRVHEAEGRGRRAFALFQAVRHPGPLVWILPSHVPELPMLRGLPKRIPSSEWRTNRSASLAPNLS